MGHTKKTTPISFWVGVFPRAGFPRGWQHPQHHQPHLPIGSIGRQLLGADLTAGLEVHWGGSCGDLELGLVHLGVGLELICVWCAAEKRGAPKPILNEPKLNPKSPQDPP